MLSRRRIETTLTYAYLEMIGVLSRSPEGIESVYLLRNLLVLNLNSPINLKVIGTVSSIHSVISSDRTARKRGYY